MKTRIALFLMLSLAGVAAAEDKRNASEGKPAASQKAAQGVPSGATEVDANTWRHVDSNGKAWLYRRTPFGINRYGEDAEKSARKEKVAEQSSGGAITVVWAKQDKVRFSRPGPFGLYMWERDRSELTGEEKEALERGGKSVAGDSSPGAKR